MENLGTLFKEWRAAAISEAANSSQPELILTTVVWYLPDFEDASFPVDSIQSNLDWAHVMAYDYYMPLWANFTGAHAALFDPSGGANMDSAVSTDGSIEESGAMRYKLIERYIEKNNAEVKYNATYVVNYCVVGSTWIGFDDVEAVKVKVSYAKQNNLLGYYAWHLANDDNWELSLAAQEGGSNKKHKWKSLVSILPPNSYKFFRKRKLMSKASKVKENYIEGVGDLNNDVPNLQVFTLANIEAATKHFSIENKLGEGGYGPVYKGILPDGQEVAVKKLSASSTQGFEEFKNEVVLTAKLQHVNHVRVLGCCIEREEKMLIYEYMPNKSLILYLFDTIRRYLLDWRKRVDIIEGIFTKDVLEANTSRIVGTYGYIPPEYLKQGLYSTKSDVYSFGVLLLQIISGKRNSCLYGSNEDLNLLEYENASERPSMLEVSSMLKNENGAIAIPKKPAFSSRNEVQREIISLHTQDHLSSVDYLIIDIDANNRPQYHLRQCMVVGFVLCPISLQGRREELQSKGDNRGVFSAATPMLKLAIGAGPGQLLVVAESVGLTRRGYCGKHEMTLQRSKIGRHMSSA
ncbi:hypothetical protein TIFTF001_038232 [Ficus carica]|uniref:non-specific serine/threonine protein kinase n=1 Tax=Ficus carica TaxID=3494 RepID=A0AA88EB60_FICCA|nr:hypothetical protein TIFTF001_038232 [Ficus carica]